MPEVLTWPGDRPAWDEVAARLREGQVVGVTSEFGVDAIASALEPKAVSRLAELSKKDVPLAVALASPQEIFDWAPDTRGAALRLARDFWPGLLILVVDAGVDRGLLAKLPTDVQAQLRLKQGLPLRLLPHDSLTPFAMQMPLAIVTLPDGADVDLMLAIEPPRPGEWTVAAPADRGATVLREGAISKAEIEVSSRCRIVFVCTGNTCRSPMAGALCRRLLADTLGIAVEELPGRGFEIDTAGLAASVGEPASPEAVMIAQTHGVDLCRHQSQPLTMAMVDRADHLFTMTAGHLRMLQSLRLPVGPEPEMLSASGEDVPDPIGGPMERYQECAEQIRKSLVERLPRILEG